MNVCTIAPTMKAIRLNAILKTMAIVRFASGSGLTSVVRNPTVKEIPIAHGKLSSGKPNGTTNHPQRAIRTSPLTIIAGIRSSKPKILSVCVALG